MGIEATWSLCRGCPRPTASTWWLLSIFWTWGESKGGNKIPLVARHDKSPPSLTTAFERNWSLMYFHQFTCFTFSDSDSSSSVSPLRSATSGDDWSLIANAMATIGGSLNRGSVYAKEFEQTFWKIMTGDELARYFIGGLGSSACSFVVCLYFWS